MKRSVSVASHHEGDAIVRALDDPATRAFVVVVGILQTLPNDRARLRVLHHVADMLNDPDSAMGIREHSEVRDEDLDADLRLGRMARMNAGTSGE